MRGGRSAVWCLGVLGWIAFSAAAACANDRLWVERVQRLILKEAERLVEQGFQPATRAMIEMTRQRDARRFIVRLRAGETYAMIAACDQDCAHAKLEIFDDLRQRMSGTSERTGVVLLTGQPDRSGLYEVELTQPGCSERHCHTGFVIMRQGEAIDEKIVVATSVGPQRGPAVAGASFGMQRRPGVELHGDNYREFSALNLADCEQRCLAELQCKALEYYREERSCGLFDTVPQMSNAKGIDVSVKLSGN